MSNNYSNSLKIGNDAELLFIEQVLKRNLTYVKATREQDIKEHWDIKVNNKTIDIKAVKNIKRYDKSGIRVIWIEINNVRGEKGWINGIADYISFKHDNEFLLVDRIKLIDVCKTHNIILDNINIGYTMMPKTIEDRKEGIVYMRPGRKDKIVIIPLEYLYETNPKIWKII